jgi:tungstate transport system ATP-binding protein
MSLYELHGVTRRYEGRTVLNLDELTIPDAGATVLLGPNGSGKSTLLDILAFLKPPDTGRMRFKGRNVKFNENHLQALRRKVVLVPQHPILFTTSVYKNVEYGLKVRGEEKSARERAVAEALDLVGMSDFYAVKSHKLSGGETQRVAIARALACRPEVILFDEPTASVDVEHQAVIERIVRDIADLGRAAVIFSTHDHRLARRLAHRRLYLVSGCLTEPVHDNVFTVQIADGGNGLAHCLAGDLLVARVETSTRGKSGISLDMKTLRLAGPGDDPGAGVALTGKITRMAYEGEGVRVLVDAGLPLRVLTDKATLDRLGLTIGDDARVVIPPEAVQVV